MSVEVVIDDYDAAVAQDLIRNTKVIRGQRFGMSTVNAEDPDSAGFFL